MHGMHVVAGPLSTHCLKRGLAGGGECGVDHKTAHRSYEPVKAIRDRNRCMYMQLRVTEAACKVDELKLSSCDCNR